MTRIYDIADEYVERFAALNPIGATSVGVSGHDAEMTDFSPQGAEARANLDRETIASLETASAEGERDRIAREAMIDELRVGLEMFDAGEHLRDLLQCDDEVTAVLAAPEIAAVFDYDYYLKHVDEVYARFGL